MNTSGTSVTWVSGAKFYPTLVNGSGLITIGGGSFTVASVGTTLGGVATTLTLGSSPGTNTGIRWCMYSSGDQWDYVALQETIFRALGAPGVENASVAPYLNKIINITGGSYEINKTLNITHGAGVHIRADQRFGVFITQNTNNTPILQANGMSYSRIEGVFWRVGAGVSGTTAALVEISWDNDGTNWTQGLQGDSFEDNTFSAENNPWQQGVRIGGAGFQGSENIFKNDHWFWFTSACLTTASANALQNTVVGGNFQNCTGDGIHVTAGTVFVYSVGFQDGKIFSSPSQTGFDVNILNSAGDNDVVENSRSESAQFVKTTNAPNVVLKGNHQIVADQFWAANSPFSPNNVVKPPTSSTSFIGGHFYLTSAACTSGGSEPAWTYTTTTDGTCTWTKLPEVFYAGGGPLTMDGNVAEMGEVDASAGFASATTYPSYIANNIFGRRDWLNPNGVAGGYRFTTNQLYNCNNSVYLGGNQNNGSATNWSYQDGNANQAIQPYLSQCNQGSMPIIWTLGNNAGSMRQQFGIGPGWSPATNADPDSTGTAKSILALIGPAAGNQPIFGRVDANGSNASGLDQDIGGGRSTGTGISGNVNFWTNAAGGSGSTLNALVKQVQVDTTGSLAFVNAKGQHIKNQAAQSDLAGVATCVTSTIAVTFTTAYTSTPVIVVSDETSAGGARVSAKSNTGFTITCTGASDVVDYMTMGNPN